MDIQQSLEHLTAQLERRGLPRTYIARLVDELDDHICDLIDERNQAMSMDARRSCDLPDRLGTANHLADAAAAEYRRRTFGGRHPILTFLVAPVPVLLVLWIGCLTAALLFARSVPYVLGDAYRFEGRIAAEWPPALFAIAWGLMYAVRVAPPLVAVTLFCWLARRSHVSWRWTLGAVLLVATLGGLYRAGFEPPSAPGRGQLFLGFGAGGDPMQLLQFLLPLLAAAWFLLRGAARPLSNEPAAEAPLPLERAA
jgi:hypothetical protein